MIIRLFTFFIITISLFGQSFESIHQRESEYYNKYPELIGKSPLLKNNPELSSPTSLSKIVYGFHPYWISDATAAGYYYSLLTHIAYFSAEVDESETTTGGFSTTRSWAGTQVVNYCKNNNVKIHFTVTMFANHSRVISNAAYRTNLVNNIISQVNSRSADGVNIDFESVSSAQKDNFRLFINELGTALKAISKELVICVPAVDWSGVFNSTFFSANNSVVDYYFIMAYDYYYRGSSTAGPVSPLTTGTSIYHVTRSINSYISSGATSAKLIAGFPYYGYDWPVTSSTRMATVVTGQDGVSKLYSSAKTTVASIPSEDKFFDATYNVPWYRYQAGEEWHQVWYDDSLSLSKKYDSVKTYNCAGTGMWALSYDGANTELWGALKKAFASTSDITNTILADFENSVGSFYSSPTFSGSTAGISKFSTAERSVEAGYNGWSSLKVVLKDSTDYSFNWSVRLVSGGGTIANNTTLNATGYIGFWLKTSSAISSPQVAITVDDIAGGTELSPKTNVSTTGGWTLYEWNLQGAGWTNFYQGNGIINGPTVTLDAIMFYAPNASPDWTIFIDDVSYNQSGPLPVELVAFYGKVIGQTVILHWKTKTETNSNIFEIEKRDFSHKDNESLWVKIGEVPASGTSNSPKEYSFTDVFEYKQKVSYRIKMLDNDGTYKYSKEIDFENITPSEYSLLQNFPNPFNPNTVISYRLPVDSKVKLEIFSILGEKITTLVDNYQPAGNYNVPLSLSDYKLSSGTYIYRLSANDFVKSMKMIILK